MELQDTKDSTSSTTPFDLGSPGLIDTIVGEKSIELVYRQDSAAVYGCGFLPRTKIYKIIYSCKKGKWHESEKIEGQYISAQDETYEF